jgi:hypothetical protein
MLWNNQIVIPDIATNEQWYKPVVPDLPILNLDEDLPYFPPKSAVKTVRKVELQIEYNSLNTTTEDDFTYNERVLTAENPLRHSVFRSDFKAANTH